MPTQKQIISILNDYEKIEGDHFFIATKKYLSNKKEETQLTQYDYLKLMSYYHAMQSLPGKSQVSRNNINKAWDMINESFRSVLGDELFENLENFKASDLDAYKTQMGQLINVCNKISRKSPEHLSTLESHPNLFGALSFCLNLEFNQKISIPPLLEDAIIRHPDINALQEDWVTLEYAGAGTPRNLVLLTHGDQTAKQLVDEYHLYRTAPILHDDYDHMLPDEMGEHIATLIRKNPKDSEIGFIEAMRQIKIANDYQNEFSRISTMTAQETEEQRLSRHSPDPFTLKATLKKASKELNEINKERTNFQLMTTEEKVNTLADLLKATYHPDWNESDMLELKKPIRIAMHDVILNDSSKQTENLEFDLEKAMLAMKEHPVHNETFGFKSEQEQNLDKVRDLAYKVMDNLRCKPWECRKLGDAKAAILDRTIHREYNRFSKAIDKLREGIEPSDKSISKINTFLSFCLEREQARITMKNDLLKPNTNNVQNSTSKGESTQYYREQMEEMKWDTYHKEHFDEFQKCIAVVLQDYGIDDNIDEHIKAGI